MADRLNVLELGDGGLGDAFEGFAGRVGKEVKVQFGHVETLSGGLSAGISGVRKPCWNPVDKLRDEIGDKCPAGFHTRCPITYPQVVQNPDFYPQGVDNGDKAVFHVKKCGFRLPLPVGKSGDTA